MSRRRAASIKSKRMTKSVHSAWAAAVAILAAALYLISSLSPLTNASPRFSFIFIFFCFIFLCGCSIQSWFCKLYECTHNRCKCFHNSIADASFRDIESSNLSYFHFQCSRLSAHSAQRSSKKEKQTRIGNQQSHEGNISISGTHPCGSYSHANTNTFDELHENGTLSISDIHSIWIRIISSPCIISESILHTLFCVQNNWLSLSRMAWK